jgi:hypothetical protein
MLHCRDALEYIKDNTLAVDHIEGRATENGEWRRAEVLGKSHGTWQIVLDGKIVSATADRVRSVFVDSNGDTSSREFSTNYSAPLFKIPSNVAEWHSTVNAYFSKQHSEPPDMCNNWVHRWEPYCRIGYLVQMLGEYTGNFAVNEGTCLILDNGKVLANHTYPYKLYTSPGYFLKYAQYQTQPTDLEGWKHNVKEFFEHCGTTLIQE